MGDKADDDDDPHSVTIRPVDGPVDDRSDEFAAYFRAVAPELIAATWRRVLGDDAAVPDSVLRAGSELLVDGGAHGVPHVMLFTNLHECEAIAEVLDDDDPRRALFLKTFAADQAQQQRADDAQASGDPKSIRRAFDAQTVITGIGRGLDSGRVRVETLGRFRRRRSARRTMLRRIWNPATERLYPGRSPARRTVTRGPPGDDPDRPRPDDDLDEHGASG